MRAYYYLFYLFGFLPSIIWLMFYLRKDKHPESNKMVLKIFIYGMISAAPATYLEIKYRALVSPLSAFLAQAVGISIVAVSALIEELSKYFLAWFGIFRNKELDEPIDIMLYMIIGALGFAAVENIMVLTRFHPFLAMDKALQIMFWRFVSATFLHALASGALGYFLALSFCRPKKTKWLFFLGLLISVSLHSLYNWSIIELNNFGKFLFPGLILIILGVLVGYWFRKIKNLKSACDISR